MVAKEEVFVGIGEFLTDTDGIGGRLRETPEDFRVKEISLPPTESKDGKWTIATVTARNWETNRLVRMMSRRLRMGRDGICFAGTKDKRAVTTQLMAFRAPIGKVGSLRLKDVELEGLYPSDKGLGLGDLIGNEFDIRVTGIEDLSMELVQDTATQIKDLEGFPNYYGIQRFGVMRPVTHKVGKHMIGGDMESAVMCYLGAHSEHETVEVQEIRKELRERKNFSLGLKMLPKHFSFERSMLQHLINKPGDYVGALRMLPKNLLWMFVHAYQSHLFNLMLTERVSKGIPLNTPIPGDLVLTSDKNGLPDHDDWIPVSKDNLTKVTNQVNKGRAFVSALVMGTSAEFAKGIQGEIESRIVEAEGLVNKDFVVPDIPEATSKGIRREVLSPVFNLRFKEVEDGLRFTFKLNRGCYATCFMREFLKADDVMVY